MKLSKRILSAVLSVVCAGSAAFSGMMMSSVAEEESESVSLSDIYDSTNEAESKEAGVETEEDAPEQIEEATASVEAPTAAATSPSTPFNVFDIYNAHQDYVSEPEPEEPPIYINTKGIDVSQWQGTINWDTVSKGGVDFAIIRAGYGKELSQKDTKFDENVKNAQASGIDCGVYWYSYALTVEAAYQEAETCYQIIKNYDFTYPIYFDIEESSQEALSTAQVSAIIEAFCSTLQAKGYYVGIYSYASFLSTKVYSNVLNKYDVWVAHYGVSSPSFTGSYGMWQYSRTGYVNGISGDVDTDYGYLNYPYIITGDVTASVTANPNIKVDTGVAQGIDVSVWQGKINWSQVAQTGVSYAIIRAGYGKLASQKDKYFDTNMANATAAGIKCGVYWYSYATSAADAKLEAEACYQVIKNYKLAYPVYFNVEDPSIAELSNSEITAIVKAFCSTLEAKGYYVGVTSYTNFLNTKIDASVLSSYDVWVAHYGVNRPTYRGSFGMWRYTNSASVNGVNGSVDRNYAYYDYPSIMSSAHLNGY